MQQKSPQSHYNKITTLSRAKIRTIMNSSAEVENVSKESAIVMSKAAELFIKYLSQKGYNETNNGRKLDYEHLADVVHSDSRFFFMKDIVPKKITVLEFKKLMTKKLTAQKKRQRDISPDASSTSSASSSTSAVSSSSSPSSSSTSLMSIKHNITDNLAEEQISSSYPVDNQQQIKVIAHTEGCSDNDDEDDSFVGVDCSESQSKHDIIFLDSN